MTEKPGFKSGFVNIFGLPNAGKSTLLNALLGEHLVITSPKVQTTRHRIIGMLNNPGYQIIFSDTPGIIDPKYKLHQKMMLQVKSALEDADVALLIQDINLEPETFEPVAAMLKLKVPAALLLNQTDRLHHKDETESRVAAYKTAFPQFEIIPLTAKFGKPATAIMPFILQHLPEAPAYYPGDNLSDRPVRFFVSELIREQIYNLYQEEIPYHAAVMIQSYEEKPHITVIKAEIVVSRETQKVILIGKGGSMIKQLGMAARQRIEDFVQGKVHLELFVKVRPKWRDNENYLQEYGYNQ